MSHSAVRLFFLAIGCAMSPMVEAAEPIVTSTSSDDYRVAWLELEGGGAELEGKPVAPFDVKLFLGLRDGRAVTAWFANAKLAGPRIVWLDQTTLEFDGKALRGELRGRTNLNWGSKNVHDYVYAVDATVSNGLLSGTYDASYTGDEGDRRELKGKLSGQFLTAEQTKSQQLPADKNWPHYYGDGQGFCGPAYGATMLDDLAAARPVWKSEAFIPTGYGSAPDSRYFDRAGRTDNGGGSSSPLVYEGRVYQFYYYPRGPVGLDKAYAKYETEADLLAKAKELFPRRDLQQRAVVNHFRTQADEVLVCLDGATGRTLWKTVFPQRGNNYQTHKHRGFFPVALIAGGIVYQPGTTGRLYAVDAASGKLLWEYPDADPKPYTTLKGDINCHAPSPVLVGDTVAFAAGGGVTAVDARSGQKKWHTPLWTRGSLLKWKGKETTYIIASDRDHEKKQDYAVALASRDGKVAWRAPVQHLAGYGFPLQAGDLLIGYSLKLENVKPGENDGLAVLHAYKLSETGLKEAWTTKPLAPVIDTVGLAVGGRHLFAAAASETYCLDVTNGEILSSVKGVGGARTQTAFVADGRLFLQPEGRHGKQSFFILSADPRDFRVLGNAQVGQGAGHPVGSEHRWLPPHSWTTAYANQPINYPVVDGRLFVRGLDAIYCYDLRKP